MSDIKVNIKDRVEWLSKRISLEGYQKDYITFQMKEAVKEALEQVKNNDLLHSVSNCSQECEWKADTFDNIGMALTEYCEECGAKRDCC